MLRTGLIGFGVLILTLIPCVASVFMPGSPFELYWNRDDDRPPYDEDEPCSLDSVASITALLTGLVLARYGLWVADISVTQITQESVDEEHRGTIGGVQSGLNYFMDLIKFALVIALPDDDTFGYLIIASFAFICLGGVSYSTFACSSSKVAAAAAIASANREDTAGGGKEAGGGGGEKDASASEGGKDNPAFDR